MGLEHLDKQVPLLADCNQYQGTYISISSELHALLFESNVNPEVSTDADHPLSSPDLQQLSSGSQFSHDQLSQLRKIIAEVIGPQRTDSDQALGLPSDVPPFSPASGLNSIVQNTNRCPVFPRLPRVPPSLASGSSKQPHFGTIAREITLILMTYCQTICTHTPPLPPPRITSP